MDVLWAPWRLAFVAGAKPKPTADACFVCSGLAADVDAENYIVHRGEHAALILNRYPYNNGHVLVVPNAHKARLDELSAAESAAAQTLITRVIAAVERRMKADGFNVGLNLGKAAGAGLPGHLHWHVVPRWSGDTNFMPVTADTRVIVQSLDSLYALLREEFAAP